MNLCALAKRGGDGSILWPKGVSSVQEVPSELARAIDHAYRILSWYENYSEEEVPPEWMWPLDHEVEQWLEEVQRARKEKFSNPRDDQDDEPVSRPTMRNEHAKELRKKLGV